MARETKKQERARLDAAEAVQRDLIKTGYPLRLVLALERASSRRWWLQFVSNKAGHHVIVKTDDDQLMIPSMGPDERSDDWNLIALERALDEADQHDRNVEIDRSIREQAVAKLSDDERRVLGIK